MSDSGLKQALDKMRAAEVAPQAIDVFAHYYRELEQGATGLIFEDSISPLAAPPMLADLDVDADQATAAFGRTAMIKLNGGLGTSMGMDRAKSLLLVRDGRSFIDLIVEQVQHARRANDAPLPLIFMNSFRTRGDTLSALAKHGEQGVDGLPVDFLQNSEPKLRADDLTPVDWPADPTLEWCPPGHGDVYVALEASGLLDSLLNKGFRYASVSNSDNLGAAPSVKIAGWFAASGAPYAAEVCRRTVNDRKGGHLAVRKADQRMILRDTAQTAAEEMHYFTDEHRHPFFHTNNLWWDLHALRETLAARDGVLGLPLIKNVKTVDPADPAAPEVIQIETAMGAAIEVFPGATAIGVERNRFLPVKTTNELLLLRSDVFTVNEDGTLAQSVPDLPGVDLDAHFKKIGEFERRLADGVPSLRRARSLAVTGDWTFGSGVTVVGAATLTDNGASQRVEDGSILGDGRTA